MAAQAPRGRGVLDHPGLLAAGAAGFASATLALWAFRGMPGGTALFWLSPFPLFAAGLGFGVAAAAIGAALAAVLVLVAGGGLAGLVFLALFGLPVPVLAAAAGAGGVLRLSVPFAFFGLWPVLVLLLAALLLQGEGGIEAAMRVAVEMALARMGIDAPDPLVSELVRVKAAAIGFWAMLALLANAAAAAGFLDRRGLLPAGRPAWLLVRLPGWYPLLPAIAAGLYLAAPAGADVVPLSALLMLLFPLFLQGLAGVHRRLEGRQGRRAMLVLFYLLLVLFRQLLAPGLVGLGLYDQFRRRPAPRQS